MATTSLRRCEGCGYKFSPAEQDDWFCSASCAGEVPAASVIVAAQQIARLAARGQ